MSSPFMRNKHSFNAEFFLQPIDQHYESKTPNRYHSATMNIFTLTDTNNKAPSFTLSKACKDSPKLAPGKISLRDFLNKKENTIPSDDELGSLETNSSPFYKGKSESVKSINDFLKTPLGKPRAGNSKFHRHAPMVFSERLMKGWGEKITFFKYTEYVKLQVLTEEVYQQEQVYELEKEITWITEN